MSVHPIPGANGGCPSALYLSQTLEFLFREFVEPLQFVFLTALIDNIPGLSKYAAAYQL